MVYASDATQSPRYISNRIFNDTGVTLFSEGQVSQFGWLWGQFIDHTLDLRNENPVRRRPSRSTRTTRSSRS
jgi:hypothetical protein